MSFKFAVFGKDFLKYKKATQEGWLYLAITLTLDLICVKVIAFNRQ